MDIAEHIRRRLREAREEAGLSQYDLAERFHTTQSTISGLERGRVDISAADLVIIAKLLGKPLAFFYPSNEPEGTQQEIELVSMYRELDTEAKKGIFAMVAAQYKLAQQAKEIEKLPQAQQEAAAIEAFARYLYSQGIRAQIDQQGFPILDGGDIHGILMTVDEKLQPILAETILRMQNLMK